MFRSIRWTLLGWYSLILLLVVGGFGGVLYWRVWRATLETVDAELVRDAQLLVTGLQESQVKPKPKDKEKESTKEKGKGKKKKPVGVDAAPSATDETTIDSKDSAAAIEPPVSEAASGTEIISGKYLWPFRDKHETRYFVIWKGKEQELLLASHPHAVVPPPDPARHRGRPLQDYEVRQQGELREIILAGPGGTDILVGKTLSGETATMRSVLGALLVAGVGVLSIGLAGGWLLSHTILRPIDKITQTASAISAANLSQRIDLAETKIELGKLAGVLNETFERLDTAFDRQSRFTADAAHELRTPLAVVLTQCELALNRKRSDGEYREALEACQRAALRMKRLADELLTLARADGGKLTMRRDRFGLRQVVSECLSLYRPLLEEKQLVLDAQLSDDAIEIVGNPDQVAELVANLVSNAIHYNREGGRIEVKLQAAGALAVFTVADTGIGIAADDQPHIFERFFRADKARSRTVGGSGLGLAICTEIVAAHGGRITVASKLDQGTTFRVELPTNISEVESERHAEAHHQRDG